LVPHTYTYEVLRTLVYNIEASSRRALSG